MPELYGTGRTSATRPVLDDNKLSTSIDHTMLDKNYEREYVHDSVRLSARIAMCSWMYPTYGLQISVKIEPNGGDCHFQTQKPFAECTLADFDALLAEAHTALTRCACGNPAWKHKNTNRNGQCEACFLRDLHAKFKKEQAVEDARLSKQEKKLRAKGYTHKVTAWIHAGGDDQCMLFYFMHKPTDAEVQAMLKRRRSRVLNDYKVEAL